MVTKDDIALALQDMGLPNGKLDVEDIWEKIDLESLSLDCFQENNMKEQVKLLQVKLIQEIQKHL